MECINLDNVKTDAEIIEVKLDELYKIKMFTKIMIPIKQCDDTVNL